MDAGAADDSDGIYEEYYDNSLTPQALPVCDVDGNGGDTLANPYYYLKQVRAERVKDEVCKVDTPEIHQTYKTQKHRRIDYTKSSAALLKMFCKTDDVGEVSGKYLASSEEVEYTCLLFKHCQNVVNHWRELKSNLPPLLHFLTASRDKWLTYSLTKDIVADINTISLDQKGSGDEGENIADAEEEDNNIEADDGSDGNVVEDDNDEDDDDSSCGQASCEADDSVSSGPLLSIVSNFSQVTVLLALQHFSAVLGRGYFHPRLGLWLFSLLACLLLPLDSDQISTLREITRSCRKIRSKMVNQDDGSLPLNLPGLKLIIIIISHGFGQMDLADGYERR